MYLCLVLLSALTTVLALAPVSLHRALFRRQLRPQMVRVASVLLKATIVAVAMTLVGTTVFVFDFVVGRAAGALAGGGAAVVVALGWLLLPALARRVRGVRE